MNALIGVSPKTVPTVRRSPWGLPEGEAPLSAFYCANCLTEWPEPFCDECGSNLMPKRDRSLAPPDGGPGRLTKGV